MKSHEEKFKHSESDHDLVGIGFGPSNISLAIALQEKQASLKPVFIEKQKAFKWHGGMLFENATMQISFLKDLVSYRNPRSEFSFVNYLHRHGRLEDFVNLKSFFPTRVEFHDYLSWCADAFREQVLYAHEATHIELIDESRSPRLRVHVETENGSRQFTSRTIVFAAGLRPTFPSGVPGGEKIIHGHVLLSALKPNPPKPDSHFLVAGAGQSSAEIVEYLYDHYPDAKITVLLPRFGYMPADDSPFVNQIFDPEAVDLFFNASFEGRDKLLRMHSLTNYSCVDLELIELLYQNCYRDRIKGQKRIEFKKLCRLQSAKEKAGGVEVVIKDLCSDQSEILRGDYLICATGFEPMNIMPLLSEQLKERVCLDKAGDPEFTRGYRLQFSGAGKPGIYCVDMCEKSHGLSSTLISNMAVRSGEIVDDILSTQPDAAYEAAAQTLLENSAVHPSQSVF